MLTLYAVKGDGAVSRYGDAAYAAFFKGYNCSQCVALAFAKEMKMTEEQALVQTDLLGHDFYVFENATTGLINVVYHRKNGGYGIIKPRIETLDE